MTEQYVWSTKLINEDNISKILYLIGKDFHKWNKNSFGKTEEVIKEIRIELENVRLGEVNDSDLAKEIYLGNKLQEYLAREEEMSRQKSVEIWLREGDRNT